MDLNDNENITTLLAVNSAYSYFVPNFNNEFGRNYDNLRNYYNIIKSKKLNMNKFSFTKYLKIGNVRPHCNCDKNDDGECLRMLNWMKIANVDKLDLHDIYNEVIGIIDFIIRIENGNVSNNNDCNDVKTADKYEQAIINKLFSNRVVSSIYMDICRTYPSILYFKEEGRNYLSKILLVYSLIDIDVGYVQGMNFLVGCILWHAHSEESAFLLLVSLMFNYGMREMFISGLPGLRVKCKLLDYLIQKKLFNIWDHIIKQGGTVDMLATDWFLTLFSYSIPLNTIGLFWDDFFEQGWIPIYKLILYRLQRIESNILSCNDIADVMNSIKYSVPSKSGILGNAILSIRDELSKSNIGRFFNSIIYSENVEVDDSTNVESTNCTHNGSTYSNDPNIISLPDVWCELISEAQYEIEIDIHFIEELESKFNSYYKLDFYNDMCDNKNLCSNTETFDSCAFNDEIKEKEEQSEVSPSRNEDSEKSIILEKNDINTLQKEKTEQTIERYKQHYSNIISNIYNCDANDITGNNHILPPLFLETKDKLSGLFDKLLDKTEKMLIRSVKREHLREISINSIEMQKHKFGPWAYQKSL